MQDDLFDSMRFFQEVVLETLASGKNVILQAPTGSGKTRAALIPLLFNLAEWAADDPTKFPRKCIYSVPMRVLANQFYIDSKALMEPFVRQERIKPEPDVTIQTGEHSTDPHFEGTLIFATIDQVLSSFLNIPYGTGDKFANLNAGAIVGSYLVFDEFHLFDPDTTLPTTLAMLKMLKGITPFVMMTATFSRTMLEDLSKELDAEVIPPLDADVSHYFSDIPAQQTDRQRIFNWVGEGNPLTAADILAQHKKRTICICNLVDRATALYDALINHPDRNGVQVTLLHSRFLQTDRAKKEEDIRAIFGAADDKYGGESHILIATQVIEVGLDITCDVMHTELAPASSLLQRAGRCARREREHGIVFVYDPPDDEADDADTPDDKPKVSYKYAPYHIPNPKLKTEHGKTLMVNTQAALSSGEFTGQHMDFEREQAFINAVHTEVDEQVLAQLKAGDVNRLEDIFKTIANLERGMASQLIRKTEDTRYVVIHPNPNGDEHLTKYPWHYLGFSLRPGMIARSWKQAEEEGRLDPELFPWVAMQALPVEMGKDKEDEGQNQPRYEWRELKDPNDLYRASIALALHPHFADYTPQRGLILGEIGERAAPPLQTPEKHNHGQYDGYVLESYAQHIAGLYGAYSREHPTQVWRSGKRELIQRPPLRDEIAYTVKQIEKSTRFGLRPGLIDEVIRLTLALHDIGKLSQKWQAFAHEWQRVVSEFYNGEDKSIPFDFMAAHTIYDPSDEAQRKRNAQIKGKMQPGNHAGEGALASIPLLLSVCQQVEGGDRLFRAAVSAIAHHHTPTVKDYHPFIFDDSARSAMIEALAVVGLPEFEPALEDGIIWEVTHDTGSLQDNMVFPTRNSQQDTLLYMLLARVLRLADGRSFGIKY